ncbi:MAG: hypothetical protein ABII79_14200 [bacterium]
MILTNNYQQMKPQSDIRRQTAARTAGRRVLPTTALVVLLLNLPVNRSLVQSSDYDDRSATATVLTALAVNATQDLSFGNVFAGVPREIGYNDDDSSAIFSITGQSGSGITLQLSLPSYLALSDGSDRIPIIFGAGDAAVDTTTVTPSTVAASNGWIDQNPYNLPSAAVIGSSGTTRIYLGGKVTPSVSQKSGTYNADIVLSVSYNGT